MAYENWKKADGSRWSRPEVQRVQRWFRDHIRSTHNPKGRIHREGCFFCGDIAEAHHPDYSQPFLVAWLCVNHHREVDHGSRKLPKKALWDYSSLMTHIARPDLTREALAKKQEARDETTVPF